MFLQSWPSNLKPRLQVGAEAKTHLMSELQAMVNNPHLSDLCLLCKDGVKVHACRMLLMARSDVLKKLLSNGMAESRMSDISLPDISSSALLPTLEYLYTGAIIKHEMDLETAFLVFHAANFFHLSTLEALLKPLLCASVNSVSGFPAILAQHLSTLDSYGITHLLCDVLNEILVYLRRHSCTACPTAFLCHLSPGAMHIFFQSLEVKSLFSTFFSFVEYLRVRSLLLWGASHISSEAEAFFECALPHEDSLALHFAALKSSGKSFLEVGLEREKTEQGLLTDSELKHVDDLHEFLGNFEWTRKGSRLVWIHPVILVAVLKPLKVFDDLASARLEQVLQYQAFRMGEMNLMKWVLQPGGISCYETQENGALLLAKIMRANDEPPKKINYALTNISFTKPDGVYETHFIVEEPAQKMYILVYDDAHSYSDISKTVAGVLQCEGGRFSLHRHYRQNGNSQKIRVKSTCLKKGDQISVVVHMMKRQCVFRVNGLELVLENLLAEVHLAAACSPFGKLRVLLVSDNTFL